MDNVFDLIEAFYEHDPGWNEILSQRDAEGYLRARTWEGAEDEELLDIWDNINCFCLYVGHTEAYIGDLNGEDIVDCIAWCARNISGFKADYNRITTFIYDLSGFYQYMAKRKKVSNVGAPLDALDLLMDTEDDSITVIDADGNFLPGFEAYDEVSAQDLPEKVYFNIGNLVDKTINSVCNYFIKEAKYKKDIARARYMFGDYMSIAEFDDEEQKAEFEKSFWEYFILDYHMLDVYKTPLQVYYELAVAGKVKIEDSSLIDMLRELLKAELVLFSIEEPIEQGIVRCRNFLTGEDYAILMDLESINEYKGMLFLGHLFYNKSITLSVVRGHYTKPSSKKVLYDILERAKSWVAVRYENDLSWNEFVADFPIFMRHAITIYSRYVRMDRFDYKTKVNSYKSQPILDDKVSNKLKKAMLSYSFSSLDVRLVQTLWSDYKHLTGEKATLPEVWTAAALYTFTELNCVYTYDIGKISEICEFVPIDAIKRASQSMKEVLAIETHDPRYVNEEGLLLMALQ